MTQPSGTDQRLAMARQFFRTLPHGVALGLEPVAVGERSLTARLPYKPEMVGNPVTGVIHGGVITALVDQSSGGAVAASLGGPRAVVTLDLRIDYLRSARPHEPAFAHAECYKLTDQIAFVRCTVYQESFDDPIATSMSTFMRTGEASATMVEGSA